jgi:preprotein translocase subunit SecG
MNFLIAFGIIAAVAMTVAVLLQLHKPLHDEEE